MSTIYLHIGTDKTGTTTLQWLLSENRDKLLTLGYLYPFTGRPYDMMGHHRLAWSISQDSQVHPKSLINPDYKNRIETELKADWDKLHKEIQQHNAPAVIISSECFCRLTLSEIKELKQKLAPFPVKVIIYLRRQDDYLCSMYSQAIIASKEIWQNKKPSYELLKIATHQEILSAWEQVFGLENMIVKGFEKSCQTLGLEQSFLQAINFESEINQFVLPKKRNERKNIKVIKAYRWCHYLAHLLEQLSLPSEGFYWSYKNSFRNRRSWLNKIIAKLPNALLSDELLSPAEKQAVMNEFSQMNQQISERYLAPEDRPLFS